MANIEKEELLKKRKEIMSEFIKNNEKNIIETTRKFTLENGKGALYITLVPNSQEVDIEYFKVDDLDGNFKFKIQQNNDPNMVFYAIRLYDTSYSFCNRIF